MKTNKSKLIVTAVGAATLAISAGVAVALADTSPPAPRPAAQLGPSLTSSSETTPSTSEPTPSTDEPTPAPRAVAITRERAIDIALSHAGGGTATRVEGEFEDGRFEWKVRVRNGGTRFDIRVDAATGAITRVDVAQRAEDRRGDDNRDDNRHDDNRPTDDRDHGGSNSGHGSGDDNSGRH